MTITTEKKAVPKTTAGAIDKTYFHAAFAGGIQMMLWDYRDSLSIDEEHILSREGIKPDLLVLKKQDIEISYDFAKLFRRHNVIDYKGPGDSLSIDEYYKSLAYSCLYKSLGNTVDEIPATQLTASIFRHAFPREMFNALRGIGAKIEKAFDGVYYVSGIIHFPTQIVVMKEMDSEIYSALRVFTPGIKDTDVRCFIDLARKNNDPGYRRFADTVLSVTRKANAQLFEEIRRDKDMFESLKDLFKDELTTEKLTGVVEAMRDDGKSDREIIDRLVTKYGISEKEAMGYVQPVLV